jgi:hypothetical protein
MSLIQSWIIYTGGLGGGGAGGAGCTMATGFSVFIFSMLSYSQLNIKNESDLCISLFFADYMYINGKYDGIIFVFLTERSTHSFEKIKTEKPVAIVYPVPPPPPPPNQPI